LIERCHDALENAPLLPFGHQARGGRLQLRRHDLAAQNLELVAENQQLDVFHVQAAAATNERVEQSTHSEIEEGRATPAILALCALRK
jgi:hypothetical protein